MKSKKLKIALFIVLFLFLSVLTCFGIYMSHDDLFSAAIDNSVLRTKVLLAFGADPNQYDSRNESTPLAKAISFNHPEVLKVLIDNHADVNIDLNLYVDKKLFSKATPLNRAILEKNIEITKLLIDAGADVNGGSTYYLSDAEAAVLCAHDSTLSESPECKNHYYTTSNLKQACMFSDPEPDIVKLLLDAGADPNWRDYLGLTVLMNVFSSKTDNIHKRSQIIEMLIEAGADVNATTPTGETVLDFCDTNCDILIKHGAKHGKEL